MRQRNTTGRHNYNNTHCTYVVALYTDVGLLSFECTVSLLEAVTSDSAVIPVLGVLSTLD